jgi:ketosteroid isomerase-like protein
VTRFVCRSCGATWLSEPAASLTGRHDGRCLRCDGRVECESENERLVRRHFDALNGCDEAALAATLDPEVTIRPVLAMVGGPPPAMHGLSSVIEAFRTLKQRFAGWSYTMREVDEHPDGRVICEGSVSVTHADGSSEAHGAFWAIRVRDGRVAEITGFDCLEAARQALDLPGP